MGRFQKPVYPDKIDALDKDNTVLKKTLNRISAFFEKFMAQFNRYKLEVSKIESNLSIRNISKVEASALRCKMILEDMRKNLTVMLKWAEFDEKEMLVAEDDDSKIAEGMTNNVERKVVIDIYNDLREAFTQMKQIISLSFDLLNRMKNEYVCMGSIIHAVTSEGKQPDSKWHEDVKGVFNEKGDIVNRKKLNEIANYLKYAIEEAEDVSEESKGIFKDIMSIRQIQERIDSAEKILKKVKRSA